MNVKKKMKIRKIIIISFTSFLLIAVCLFLIYISNYYHADDIAMVEASKDKNINISNINGALVFDPGNADTALIFYPGGKVEYTAYQPLMIKTAQKGILCILPKMPFNLAVFDINAADEHISQNSKIQHWLKD